MKKIFISLPMKYRKDEDIQRTIHDVKSIVDVIIKEPHTYIDSWVKETPPVTLTDAQRPIWYLGKSIDFLSQADIMVSVDPWDKCLWAGVGFEHDIARAYHLQVIDIPSELVCPDLTSEFRNEIYMKLDEGNKEALCHPLSPCDQCKYKFIVEQSPLANGDDEVEREDTEFMEEHEELYEGKDN